MQQVVLWNAGHSWKETHQIRQDPRYWPSGEGESTPEKMKQTPSYRKYAEMVNSKIQCNWDSIQYIGWVLSSIFCSGILLYSGRNDDQAERAADWGLAWPVKQNFRVPSEKTHCWICHNCKEQLNFTRPDKLRSYHERTQNGSLTSNPATTSQASCKISLVYRNDSFCTIVLRSKRVTTSRRMRQSNTVKSVRVAPYAIFLEPN